MDILQPDCTKNGGLSESRRIAWLASDHNVQVVPHGWNTAVGLAADLQFSAADPRRPLRRVPHPLPPTSTSSTTEPFRLDAEGLLDDPDRARAGRRDRPGQAQAVLPAAGRVPVTPGEAAGPCTTTSGPRPTRIRWRVFALACGTSFLLYLHRYTWNIVGPELQEDFGLSNTQAGFLFSLFYYTYAGGPDPQRGRRRPVRARTGSSSLMIVAWSVAIAAIGQTASPVGARRLAPAVRGGAGRLLSGADEGHAELVPRGPPHGAPGLDRHDGRPRGRGAGADRPRHGPDGVVRAVVADGAGRPRARRGRLRRWSSGGRSATRRPSTRASTQAERKLDRRRPGLRRRPAPSCRPGRAWRSRSLRFFVLQQFLDAGSDVAFVSLIGTYFLRARGFDVAKTGLAGEPPALGRRARGDRGRAGSTTA